MSFFDDVSRRVKQKAEEWDVQTKAEKFAAEVDKVAHEAKDKAAEYADENRSRFREGLDKVGAKIDEQTDGKYHDKVAKATQKLDEGVGKLAEQRPPRPAGASGSSTAGYASGPAAGTTTSATEGTPASSPEPYTPEPYTADPIEPAQPLDDRSPTGWPQDQPPH
ncbi:MAG TPA: Rv0909 family putative TA system antitoxin [Lapillicoccus sp.]